MIVRTVTGDLNSEAIGRTTMHEHLILDASVWLEDPRTTATVGTIDPGSRVGPDTLYALHRNPRLLRDNLILDDEDLAAEEILEFRRSGGDCIVDVTTVGLGRNVRALRRLAERTGIKVVAGTGYYIERSYPPTVRRAPAEELAEGMIRDIEEGVDGSGIKAGIIGEIGTSVLTEGEAKTLEACALAQRATGAAISIHTEYGCRIGVELVEFLGARGVAPSRVIVGHLDENLVEYEPAPVLAHLDYHIRVAETGAWIQYDTFGSEWYYDQDGGCEPRDTERIAGIVALIDAGYVDQILLAQDVWLKQCLRRYGGCGYDHIVRVIPNLLRRHGVADEAIEQLLVDNPRRALALQEAIPE